MVRICYTYSVEKNSEIIESSTEKVFKQFSDMAEAKVWARTKWKSLNWPNEKAKFKHTFVVDGVRHIIEGWKAKTNRDFYISHFELTMTESYKEN